MYAFSRSTIKTATGDLTSTNLKTNHDLITPLNTPCFVSSSTPHYDAKEIVANAHLKHQRGPNFYNNRIMLHRPQATFKDVGEEQHSGLNCNQDQRPPRKKSKQRAFQ
ncbi:hypothetical protein EmuJ_000127500 [Echinococcus multilocularis]|uniref:Uncharacterized protein n=1 Tax=Echinococcus multilocularis TaxID=6211 RepID=A0A087VZ49_ECHMU|nr:hypothetical protein EmuJ_000127500 [Echinococcus multilocularis]